MVAYSAPLNESEEQESEAFEAGFQQGLSQATRHRGEKRAVIGEQQQRVLREAKRLGALTIRFTDKYDYSPEKIGRPMTEPENLISLAYNMGWIYGIMNSGFKIYDIGRSEDYMEEGRPVSRWYREEVRAIAERRYQNYRREFVADTGGYLSYGI